MLAERYAFPLLLWSVTHVFAMNDSFQAENSTLPQILAKNTSQLSVGSTTSTPISFHPTSAFNAAPSSSHSTISTHLPFDPSPSQSTPIGHLSASISTHAPVAQRPSSPISHHPLPPEPNPSHSTSHNPNSSDTTGQHSPPFHHPPPSNPNPNNTHSSASGPSVAQIFFEAFGGVVGLVVVLAVARCFYVYRRTPTSRRPPTPDIGEAERTMALLRPGRLLNLGERVIPPPPYQPAPDYDSVVVGTESTGTHPSVGTSTTTPSTSCITPTIVTQQARMHSLNNPVSIPVSAPITTTTSSSILPPPSQESIPPTSTYRPPDVQVSV